ncbi:MAG TPA: hypothetical protein GX010_01045 [Erysipelotrichaceae bacterium]|nr:hypothetical protein [Erysipelotrichaceae bacterium]
MPSANSGKRIVKNIRVNKKNITLTFLKGKKIQISQDAYVSTYLYEGKTLSKKEINHLLELTALSSLLKYATNLVSKRLISERKMLEKLLKKANDLEAAKKVIAKLKASNLLNDRVLIQNLVDFDNERKYGKNKIIKHLKNQGIADNMISDIAFPLNIEKEKAETLSLFLEKKYGHLSYMNKKKHVYQALLARGFSSEIAYSVINNLKRDIEEEEKAKLIRDYQVIRKRYQRKYEGYQLKQKTYGALINKGYQYRDIKEILEDKDNENDC